MKTRLILLLVLVSLALASFGCRTHSGSREFIPGKGWVPND
jgi:predicted small secreted protein